MRILALLPDDSERALQRVLRSTDTLKRVADAPTLAAEASRADAVVLDPTVLGGTDWAQARQLLERPTVAVLLYASLNPDSVARLVEASAVGVHEILLFGLDDDAATVRRRLDSLRRPEPPAAVLSKLAPRLAVLPAALQEAAIPLFCAAPIPRWAGILTSAASMPRRTADRWMHRAGIAGTATLLDVARLARVWVPLVDRREPTADLVTRLGFRRVRILADHTARLLGVAPSDLGTRLGREAFVERLTDFAVRD